jgi:hypothetical protein
MNTQHGRELHAVGEGAAMIRAGVMIAKVIWNIMENVSRGWSEWHRRVASPRVIGLVPAIERNMPPRQSLN